MIFADFIFAFLIALALAGILGALFGQRGVRRAGTWPIFVFLFFLLLMMTWAGGAWITPFGPVFWGGYWLPFLFVGIMIALLVAALMPPARRPARRDAALPDREEEEAADLAVGAIFWIVIVLLGLTISARYV